MRKVLALVVFLMVLGCAAAQAASLCELPARARASLRLVAAGEILTKDAVPGGANEAVSKEEQRKSLMEAGRRSQPFHAIIFKTDETRMPGQSRAYGPYGVEISEKPVPSATLSPSSRSLTPFILSRQSVLHQNLVERK